MATCTAGHAARVEVGVLVEGDLKGAVHVAEYVAAFAAVVPAREVAKVSLARRVVADSGFVVGLW